MHDARRGRSGFPEGMSLAPGGQHVQETYVSHPWIVTEENGRCIGLYMPEATRRRVEIRAAEMPASRQ
jgi:hypothetical protein